MVIEINGIFSTLSHPQTVKNARKSGIKIHWLHSLFDYEEGKKSFNQISALMVRAKNHHDGLTSYTDRRKCRYILLVHSMENSKMSYCSIDWD